MKPLFTLLIALCAAATASAGSLITAVVTNGNWGTNSTWSLNRQPGNGDTVLIPANKTVLFNTDENLNGVLIRIYGVLNMNAGKKLNLDNVSVIRVYPGGTIMGTGSSDQIRIGSTHVFDGSEPDITGPMFADQTTGSGFAPMQVMPVTFVNFYVSKEKDQVKIYWSTATESNNDHFEVERSVDGTNWTVISIVMSAGNSNAVKNYSLVDKKLNSAAIYYRIKQVDIDGRFTYTAIKSVSYSNESTTTQIFASTNNDIIISFDALQKNVVVKIWNMSGQSLKQQTYSNSAYITLKLNNNIRGIYVVQVTDANNNTQSKKILLN